MSRYAAGYLIARVFAFLGWLIATIGCLFVTLILFLAQDSAEMESALGIFTGALGLALLAIVFLFFLLLYGLLFVGLSHVARAIFDTANNTSRMIKLLGEQKGD